MTARRPVIGITAAIERAAWTVWSDIEANITQRTYTLAVTAAGGLPIVLPPDPATTSDPGQTLDLVDGLILAGGADIEPAAYGAEAAPQTTGARPERDRFELALARTALKRDLPLLGICRGMELLNVALGGTLIQNLPDAHVHLHTPGTFADHDVRLEPGSTAARIFGTERLAVRSHHHQGIDRVGAGLRATGWAEPGGAIEALEVPNRRFALGLLWHTEEDRHSPAITGLCKAAREHAEAVAA
jgi:putative glutamine amidotransferase